MACRRAVARAAANNDAAFTHPINRMNPDWEIMRLSIEVGITHHPDGSPIIDAARMSESQRSSAYTAMCAIADAMNPTAARRGVLRDALQGVISAFGVAM